MNSEIILNITWDATKIFFFLSMLFLGIFFYTKITLSKWNKIAYQYFSNQDYTNIDNLTQFETILYANHIGQEILKSDKSEAEKLMHKVRHLKLGKKIFKIYKSKKSSYNKIYLLPILASFRDERYRNIFVDIIEKFLVKKLKFEFVIWSLFGLALSTKRSDHIKSLYDLLVRLNQKCYSSQIFYQYFLSKSLLSAKRKEVILFSEKLHDISITPVAYALISAFKKIEYSEKIYKQIETYRKRHNYDARLLFTILDLYSSWKIDSNRQDSEYFIAIQNIVNIRSKNYAA